MLRDHSKTDSIRRVEQDLCNLFGRRYCCLTGRGATAIYCALKSLPASKGKIVLPTILCPSPANAVLYAGFEPVFCDVRLRDFTMDVESLERVIAQYDDVVGVIPVHLYGHCCDMNAVMALAKRKGLYVIEDAAQAMGGVYEGRRLGSQGDVSIVSFGHTKILDVRWGGAALTDDKTLFGRMKEALVSLPSRPDDIDERSAEYRQVYYTLKPLTDTNERLNELFLPLPAIYKDIYLFQITAQQADAIADGLDSLDRIVDARRHNASRYRQRLRHPAIIHPEYGTGDVPWRYSFLLKGENQKDVTDGLRNHGIHVSNWYPPLHAWYSTGRAQAPGLFPNAEFIASHVVNLWVEPEVTSEEIDATCERLRELL